MKVIEARNVNQALLYGLQELKRHGVERESRNGPVLMMPEPVTTIYRNPMERVVLWAARDANPFFHLYESLWMLAGREDVTPLLRYAQNMANYSDDEVTLHGAYGHRWRYAYDIDQLPIIAQRLRDDPNDRRCVLQMWDTIADLDQPYKDVPCNVMATFQRDVEGRLDLVVFCRSNDIIWGAYGANAVHFSMLQEYMANCIGCPIGRYYQVSVNWHAYFEPLNKIIHLTAELNKALYSVPTPVIDPYVTGAAKITPMPPYLHIEEPHEWQLRMDSIIDWLLQAADTNFKRPLAADASIWEQVVYHVLLAHHTYKTHKSVELAKEVLYPLEKYDWVVAAREWLDRRKYGVGRARKSNIAIEKRGQDTAHDKGENTSSTTEGRTAESSIGEK